MLKLLLISLVLLCQMTRAGADSYLEAGELVSVSATESYRYQRDSGTLIFDSLAAYKMERGTDLSDEQARISARKLLKGLGVDSKGLTKSFTRFNYFYLDKTPTVFKKHSYVVGFYDDEHSPSEFVLAIIFGSKKKSTLLRYYHWKRDKSLSPNTPTPIDLTTDIEQLCKKIPQGQKLSFVGTWKRVPFAKISNHDEFIKDFTKKWIIDNFCFKENLNFGKNGWASEDDGPTRLKKKRIKQAAQSADFLFHFGHGAPGTEHICRPAKSHPQFKSIWGHGIALPPLITPLGPIPTWVNSCGLRKSWAETKLKYFWSMSSFFNLEIDSWASIVGGKGPKVIVGNMAHGDRFNLKFWAMFNHYLGAKKCSQDQHGNYQCERNGFSFSDAAVHTMANCIAGDWLQDHGYEDLFIPGNVKKNFEGSSKRCLNPKYDKKWPIEGGGGKHHPKRIKIVYSNQKQLFFESLPGFGKRYPEKGQIKNDSNHQGWALEVRYNNEQ
ncbi:MAG: hypothetical protein HOE90_17810 [Bacteriovoracaceae bacterium]|jgi:hypothetical protein|nr:hypothetical protein [Bacteriovoracaceae bacterium]